MINKPFNVYGKFSAHMEKMGGTTPVSREEVERILSEVNGLSEDRVREIIREEFEVVANGTY